MNQAQELSCTNRVFLAKDRLIAAFRMERVTILAVTSVHKGISKLNRRSKRDDVRGVGDESCSM
jgi:hypothetical protein